MIISQRLFLASQALYGWMICHHIYDEQDENIAIATSLRLADNLISQDKITREKSLRASKLLERTKKKDLRKIRKEILYGKP